MNNSDDTEEKRIDQIIDISRFHKLTSLLRLTALVIQCAKKFKNRVWNESIEEDTSLNATDLKEAEHLWIKSVQASSFTKEIEFLQCKDPKLKKL